MYEMLYVAAASRLPITLACVNRTLTGPININNDHSDSMGARDTGWIQLYAENNQEVYDNYLQAMRIAETPSVRLPIMVCQDGFITSHAVENILLEDDEAVKRFVGHLRPSLFFALPVLLAVLRRFFLGFCLVVKFLLLLHLGVIGTHARQFVLHRQNGMPKEHLRLTRLHYLQKFFCGIGAETRTITPVADWLRDAVRAAINLR